MNAMEIFCIISGTCSIISLIISLFVLKNTLNIIQKIKGNNNITVGKGDVNKY